MKVIYVSNGSESHSGTTRATTEAGYCRAAQNIWPYSIDYQNTLSVRVYDGDGDDDSGELIFDGRA